MVYHFDVLRSLPKGGSGASVRRRQEAQAHNKELGGRNTLGIEVTDVELVALCELGNIDPQHGENGRADRAAIEDAISWLLPPRGANLVTQRIDLDALGAMAVLLMRHKRQDWSPSIKTCERIALIATADKFANGPWPGPRPLPQAPREWRKMMEADTALPALNSMLHEKSLSLADKVYCLEDWLQTGSWQNMGEHAARAEQFARSLQKSFEAGEVETKLLADGQLVRLTSVHPGALTNIGYRLAPVVVACNPYFSFRDNGKGRKYTIAQYASGHVDLATVVDELNRLEAGWGGQPNIVGSPQGAPSELDFSDIKPVVEKYLRSIKTSYFSNIVSGGRYE